MLFLATPHSRTGGLAVSQSFMDIAGRGCEKGQPWDSLQEKSSSTGQQACQDLPHGCSTAVSTSSSTTEGSTGPELHPLFHTQGLSLP